MTTTATKPSDNGMAPLALAPSALDEFLPSERLMRYCEFIATSNLVPKEYRGRPADVLIAVQMGLEIGLRPAQSLQSIAVINGKPSIYGDAALAVIKQHPQYEGCKETEAHGEGDARKATCTMKRKGDDPVTRSFSVLDAKRAKLWDKEGPWKTYPDRMLQMRARGFAGRDAFPDALKGLSFAEEAMDIPAETATQSTATGATRTERVLAKVVGSAKVEETPADDAPATDTPASNSLTPEEEKTKARDLRTAIGKTWQHIPEEIRKATLQREYAKATLLDLNVSQLEDFLARTPELMPVMPE
jgi:hypothetical protein